MDQIGQHVVKIIGNSSQTKQKIKSLFSSEYDNNPEYKFMEELRNYSQHEGIPVKWTTLNCSATESDDERNIEFSVEFGVEKSELENSDFKE